MTRHSISRLALGLLVSFQLGASASVPAIWTVLAIDPKGDTGSPSGADAAQFAYHYDRDADTVWFRVALYGSAAPDAFGIQIAVDTGRNEAAKASWWGANKAFQFDRLLTARVTRKGSAYSGTVGVADAAGAR